MFYYGPILDRRMHFRDFVNAFRMAKYTAIILPCIFYVCANTYGSLLFGLTGASIAKDLYGFNPFQTGLWIGIPLFVGCLIGESCAGWVSDMLINAYAKRHGGYRKAEVRLWLIPLCFTLCIGIITFGAMAQMNKPWIDLALPMGVAGVGLQVATTMTYTYCTDCYKPQSAEVAAVINLSQKSKLPCSFRIIRN